MRKSITVYYDSIKDKELIEWLMGKSGISSFIKHTLYRIMKEEKGIIIMTTPQAPMIEQEETPKIEQNFKNSFMSFIKKD